MPSSPIIADTGDIYAGLDRFGRIKDVRWRSTASSTDLSRIQYGYDRVSNRVWRANPSDPNQHYDWKYGYDGLQRLKDGQRGTLNGTHTGITSPQFGQCWTLDETGNWSAFQQSNDGTTWSLEQTRTANSVNELLTINATVGEQWADPKYDANGNMTTIPRPGLNRPSWANLTTDQWGALTVNDWSRMEVAPTFRATYDAWNRLVKLTDGGNGETVQESEYDGRGYRIVTKTYTDGTLAETRHAYFTDQWQCIEERLGTSTTPDRQFVWGLRYIDDCVLRNRDTNADGTLDERLYALQDANWNVTAVADAAGDVQERYAYQPYGQPLFLDSAFTPQSASNFDWETLFPGYRWDETTELYMVRHRTLHAVLGAWQQRDSLNYVVSFNLYEYVASNPISRTDSSGLKWDCIVCACCGGSAGITCSALCATSHWDVPGESFGSCFWKCVKAVPGASQTWDLACVTACAACGGRKLPKVIPCSKRRKQQLQAVVNLACKGSGPFSCNATQSCATLKANYGKAMACATARDAINTICFRGGDKGHRQAADNARRAAAKCSAIAASKGCP